MVSQVPLMPRSHSAFAVSFFSWRLQLSDVTAESRQSRVTLEILGRRRTEASPGPTPSLPPFRSNASPTDESPGLATEVDDPNLSKTEGGG